MEVCVCILYTYKMNDSLHYTTEGARREGAMKKEIILKLNQQTQNEKYARHTHHSRVESSKKAQRVCGGVCCVYAECVHACVYVYFAVL